MNTFTIQRRIHLDWLRVAAVLLVFVYHTTRLFNLEDWHVKNAVTYEWVEIWNIWVTRWMMPLFFVISGASLFFALERFRGFLGLLKSKTLRLMIPVFVAMFSHGILQVYIERLSHGKFTGNFFEFLPHYFSGVYLKIGGKGNFAFHGMHLWYLLFLFVYSLMLYLLFRWFRGGGKRIIDGLAHLMALPGVLYIVLLLPFFLMRLIIPEGILRVGNGGWGFLFYIWFLISGFILYSNPELEESMLKQRWISLGLGLFLTVTGIILRFTSVYDVLGPFMRNVINVGYGYIGSWAIILTILGFGMKHLRKENGFLTYSNEAGIAFYILHQPVVVCAGYFIVQKSIPDITKWSVITALSFALIMLLYEYGVRRFNIMRFLFGMKPRQS